MEPQQFVTTFQQNKFLNSIRQRLVVTGASCNFDLPQLHYWLASPAQDRQQQAQAWVDLFSPIINSIQCILYMIRESEPYHENIAKDGFFSN